MIERGLKLLNKSFGTPFKSIAPANDVVTDDNPLSAKL